MIMGLRSRTKTNPVFYADRLRRVLEHDPERVERAFNEPASVDLLTWNVFESLDSDRDREYLAGILQPLGGSELRAPLRITLWTGRHREPLLQPSYHYTRHVRARAKDADDEALAEFLAPMEVPVRIESPDVLVLVDTCLDGLPRGSGGRDRITELIDAGLDHARRLSKQLVVGFVYRSGTLAASELSGRINRLRNAHALAAAMPYRSEIAPVQLREMTWQQLLQVWENNHDHLALSGEPVRDFLDHARGLGLR